MLCYVVLVIPLAELIVVVAILALLAAIALPRFMNSRKVASETAHLANVRVLRAAATTYLANADGVTTTEWTSSSGDWEDYIETWPDNPMDKEKPYTVTINADGKIIVDPNESEVSSTQQESSGN